jgi:hypothetical protein
MQQMQAHPTGGSYEWHCSYVWPGSQSVNWSGALGSQEHDVPAPPQSTHVNCSVCGQSVGTSGALGSQRHVRSMGGTVVGKQYVVNDPVPLQSHLKRCVAPQSLATRGWSSVPLAVAAPPMTTVLVPVTAGLPPAPICPARPLLPCCRLLLPAAASVDRSTSVDVETMPPQPLVSEAPTTTMLFSRLPDCATEESC